MEDAFRRSSPSAALVTVKKKNQTTALVCLYSFPPTHDASHPSFQVFATLPQSHVPHPDPALLWLCCKSAPAVPQRPDPTHCLHRALEGVTTESALSASPLHTACKKNVPSTTIQEAQVVLAPQKQYMRYPNGAMSANQKMPKLASKTAHHPLFLILIHQKTACRRTPTAAKLDQLNMDQPSGCIGASDSFCSILASPSHS